MAGSLASLMGETGGVIEGVPMSVGGGDREKKDKWPSVSEESEHLTGDQRGFHTSCGRLFELIPDFIPVW